MDYNHFRKYKLIVFFNSLYIEIFWLESWSSQISKLANFDFSKNSKNQLKILTEKIFPQVVKFIKNYLDSVKKPLTTSLSRLCLIVSRYRLTTDELLPIAKFLIIAFFINEFNLRGWSPTHTVAHRYSHYEVVLPSQLTNETRSKIFWKFLELKNSCLSDWQEWK